MKREKVQYNLQKSMILSELMINNRIELENLQEMERLLET